MYFEAVGEIVPEFNKPKEKVLRESREKISFAIPITLSIHRHLLKTHSILKHLICSNNFSKENYIVSFIKTVHYNT